MAVGTPVRISRGQIAVREEESEGTAIAITAAAYLDVKPENVTYTPDIPFYPRAATSASFSRFAGTSGGPRFAEIAFEVSIAGSGTAGTAPSWGPLLKGCGFYERLVASTSAIYGPRTARPVTSVDADSNLGQKVLNVASTQDFHGGDLIHIDKDASGGGAETGVVDTVQDGVSLTLVDNLTYTHTAVQADAVMPYPGSVTLGWYVDGLLYKIDGARGNVRLILNSGEPGKFAFTFRGAYNEPEDVNLITSITYESTVPPAIVSGSMTLDTVALKYKSLELDMGNTLADRPHVDEAGAALSVVIADREPTGTLDPEMLAVATYNYFSDMTGNGEGAFTLTDGSAAGNIVTITGPKFQYSAVEPGDRDGVGVAGLTVSLNSHRATIAVSDGSWAGDVVTFTAAAHAYAIGTVVIVSACGNASYDGTYTVLSVPSANTFTATLVGDPGAWTTAGVVNGIGDNEISIANT